MPDWRTKYGLKPIGITIPKETKEVVPDWKVKYGLKVKPITPIKPLPTWKEVPTEEFIPGTKIPYPPEMTFKERVLAIPETVREALPSFTEAIKKIPEKIVWGTILTIPGVRDKYIEENPQAVIDFVDDYEKIVAPYLRTAYPTRIPLAIAEKVVGKQLAPTLDELREKSPVATTISSLVGDIQNITTVFALTGGLGDKIAIPGTIKNLFPTLSRYVPKAIEYGTTWGIRGVLDETISQFEKGKFKPEKIASEGGKEFLFGTLLAAPLVLESVPLQIAGMGAMRGGWATLGAYLEDGVIDGDDLLNIGANTILGLVFGALGVKSRVSKIHQERIYNITHQKLVVKISSTLKISMKEAETQAILVEQLGFATSLSKAYPNKTLTEIWEMAKLFPKEHYIPATIKPPIAIMEQIKNQIPKNLKDISKLSGVEQTKMIDQVMKTAMPLIEKGQPIWESILMGLQGVGFPVAPIPKVIPPVVKPLPEAPKVVPKAVIPKEGVKIPIKPKVVARELTPKEIKSIISKSTPVDFEKMTSKIVEAKLVTSLIEKGISSKRAGIISENLAPDAISVFRETKGTFLKKKDAFLKTIENDLKGVKIEPVKKVPLKAPVIERLGGLPKRRMVAKYEERLVAKRLAEKVGKVYEKIDLVKYGKTKIGRVIQEETILKAIEKGETMAAKKAFVEGKRLGIFEAKEHYKDIVARAKKMKGLREDLRTITNKIKDNIKKANIKHLRPERQANIKQIIKDIDMAAMRPTTKKRLESRLHYIKENPDNMLPDEKIAELERLNRKPLSQLTIMDLSLMEMAISHEVKLNELKNKLIFGRRYVDAKETIDLARKNVNKKTIQRTEDPTIIDSEIREPRIGKLRQIFSVDSYNPELITEIMDREKHGIIKKILYGGIDEGTTNQYRNFQTMKDMIKKDIEGINLEGWSKSFEAKVKNINFQTIKITKGRLIKLTKGERVAFILHSKNKKNLAHILDGGLRFESNMTRKHRISEADLDMIIKSATPQENKVADVFSKFFNKWQKPEINKVSVDLNGFEIAVEPDYYPIRTAEIDRIRDALKLRKNFSQATLEGMGMFKERVGARNAIIVEDAFKTIYTHLRKTSSYIGLAKPLRNAKMLLQDGGFQENIMKVYGKPYYDSLNNYIKMIEDSSHNVDSVDKLVADLVNKLDVAILGLNPFVMAKQPVSYLMAMTEMNAKYLAKALKTKVNPEEISKWSPQLRDRFEGRVTREVGELSNIGVVKNFFTDKKVLSNRLMGGIRKFDYATVGRIWNAVKFEVKDTHPTLKGDDYMKAVTKRAEEVIRLTQPTFNIKDRSAIGRDPVIWKRILTKYTSQRNKNFNAIRRAVLEYDTSNHSSKAKSRLTGKLFIITVLSSLMIGVIDELRRMLYGKPKKGLFSQIVRVFGNTLSYVYFAGDIFSSLVSKIEYGTFGGWDMGNPVSSFMDNAISGIAEGVSTIDQVITGERYKAGEKKGEAKWKTSIMRFLNQTISTASKIKGIPYDTVKKILWGVWEIVSGKRFEKKPKGGIPKPSIPKISIPKPF